MTPTLSTMTLLFLAVIIATLALSCDAFSTTGRQPSSIVIGGGGRCVVSVQMIDESDGGIDVQLDTSTTTDDDDDDDNDNTSSTTSDEGDNRRGRQSQSR